MKDTQNLWNAVYKKTRRVIQYIREMEPPQEEYKRYCKRCGYTLNSEETNCPKCGHGQSEVRQIYDLKKFENIKEKALEKTQPNEMLETIGYVNNKVPPKIYEEIKTR